MRRPYRVLARVVVLGMLAGAAGCFVDDPGHPRGFPEAAVDDTASPSPSPPPRSPFTTLTPPQKSPRVDTEGGV
ncbi:hypothetical protein PV439_43925, partial [Streptomyces scabiei]|nr:hypothetical protein [Streptomyces scabiei]